MLFVTRWSTPSSDVGTLFVLLKDKSPLQILGRTNGTRARLHPYHPSAHGSRPFSLPCSSSHPHSIRHCRRNSSSVSKSLVPNRSKCLFVLWHISVYHRIPALLLLLSFLLFFYTLETQTQDIFSLASHTFTDQQKLFLFFFHCVFFCMTVVQTEYVSFELLDDRKQFCEFHVRATDFEEQSSGRRYMRSWQVD